ncbi:PEP-CTERM sorting domain-containing protein [Lusitaniella coriacea]|uniref:PEP-CTERM sorting domain-containing protein n=1 Tax=Lusitaniella coriacea TaxID=1983105 RepID=UPI003CE86C9A
MKLQTLSNTLGLIASSALVLSTTSAQAAKLSAADCVGSNYNCTITDPFFSVAGSDGAGNAQLTRKSFANYEGIGVATNGTTKIKDDPSWGEIDYDETLTVNFAEEKAVDYIDLGFLYKKGNNSDKVNEIAEVTAFDTLGNTITGILSVISETTATWSLGGTVTTLSNPVEPFAGLFRITNPFGDMELDGLSFTAVDSGRDFSRQSWDSDFVVGAVKTVPEPGTLLGLLGISTLGMLKARRRQK